jgi:small-conductance mechanosensitive channel
VQSDAFLTPSVLQDALVFAGVALFVALLDRRERRRVMRVVLLGAVGFAIHFAAHLMEDRGLRGAPAFDVTGRVVAAVAGVALLGTLLFDVLLPLAKMRPPRILRDLAIAAGSIAAALAILSSGKIEVAGIVATSAVLTAVVGWALQDTLANVMGGLALQLDGSVKAGDWVTFGETTGLVREVGWRQTTLETRNRDYTVVPNSLFMKGAVVVRGKGTGTGACERRWIRFAVDSGAAPPAVIACAEKALRGEEVPGVDSEPAPDCVFFEYEDSASRFALRYWTSDMFRAETTDSLVRSRLWFALHRSGIPLAAPVRHVVLTHEGEKTRERADATREAAQEAIGRVSILSPLTEHERERLAQGMVRLPFAAGESLVVQGAEGHDLYILTKGRAEVRLAVPGAAPRAVATLEAPDFFGEMGLLTGERRKATVAALTEAEAWRVEKDDFHEILEKMRVARSQPLTLAKIREFFGIG